MSYAIKTTFCAWAVLATLSAVSAGDDAGAQQSAVPDMQKFRLEFQGQPWLPALQWFAEKAQLNLDWQTLPEGELNLSAQEPYTLEEVRDVLNMQLLVRGFTLLQRGDVIRVVPLENLDPTLVARVRPEELEDLSPHQFVRVSFPLEWMIAEEAARELAPLLSPYGKLIPLAATNQLEAMDAVVNLREIERLLDREQSDSGKQRLVEEFRLEHRRAYDVADMLRQLLGLDNTRFRRQSDRMRFDLERTKLQSEAVKQLGENATRFLKDEPEVNFVVNEEENSILVHAPPDKVEVIRQAIRSLDRPSSKMDAAWENINRVKAYKVDNVDVDSVRDMVDQMQQLGRLNPEMRIEIDQRNATIIAYATPSDHLTLAHLVRSFQQEPREAHVIQLRALEPRYAAQAVRVLFNQSDQSDDWRRRRSRDASQADQFRVEADTQHRRLLLWATVSERTRVDEYLNELGEQSTSVATQQGVQVLQSGTADLAEIETKVRNVWGHISKAPLVIQSLPGADGERDDRPETKPAARQSSAQEPDEKTTSQSDLIRTASLLQVAGDDAEDCTDPEESGEGERAAEQESEIAQSPPVKVIAGADGRLIVVSDDPEAARLMTQLLESLLPPERDVHVIPLKHASALSVEFQLYDLLNLGSTPDEDPFGSQPQLVVYSDRRTNSLLVRNADAEQLKTIRGIVEVLDRPEQVEPELAREQRVYRVRYKDATQVAETVKEVYRDLLSSSDKAFSGGNDRERRRSVGYSGFSSSRSTVPEYQGLLAIGAEPTSNTVVVSAPQYLMQEVMGLVESLDQQASAQAVSIVRLQSGISSDAVRQSLSEVLGEAGGNGNNNRRGRR